MLLGALIAASLEEELDFKGSTATELAERVSANTTPDDVQRGLQRAVSLDCVVRLPNPEGSGEVYKNPIFAITPKGVAWILVNIDGFIENIHGLTWDIPDDIVEAVVSLVDVGGDRPLRHVPGSNRTVSISDNQALAETCDTLEVAKEAIRTSNHWEGEDRETILKTLSTGIDYLKSGKVLVAAVTGLILAPLYNAYSALAEDSARELILKAIELVKSLVGG